MKIKKSCLFLSVYLVACLFMNISVMAQGPGGDNQGGGSSESSVSYDAETTISSSQDISDATYSTSSSIVALMLAGDIEVSLDNITVMKTGSYSGDSDTASFYGVNAAILARNGANVTITNSTIETDATGANGVFANGGYVSTNNTSTDGTTITISDSTITTNQDASGGIMVTGGGTLYAYDLTVTTAGTSSAAIRSDRGGGTMVVDGGTYTTTGVGSPAIYSTADITVSNAELTTEQSEGLVVEGTNSITIIDCDVTGNNVTLNGQSTTYKTIFLYQSMSGDASDDGGNSSFYAEGSTITTLNGDAIYVTNTTTEITLINNTFVLESDGYFLRAQADSWGNSGSNGGNVTLLMENQTVEGDIYLDEISSLTMTLSESSAYAGIINGDNTGASIDVVLDESSTLTLTGDSYVSSLSDADDDYTNIITNGYTLYVDGEAMDIEVRYTEDETEKTVETIEAETDNDYTLIIVGGIVVLVVAVGIILVVKKKKKIVKK